MEQPLFWSDQLAYGVINKFEDRETHTCAAGVSPSGKVHIGHLREVITVDFVVKSLQMYGEDTRFIYSWDDYDRFRKVPENVPDEWEQYLGLPLSKVPDPWECHESYARHFESQLEEQLEDLHMDVEFIRQSEMFQDSVYADEIRTAMRNREEIRGILNEYRKELLGDDWYPLRVYCRDCGRDDTEVLEYNGNFKVEYYCNECGKKRKIDFKEKDSVKPPWRVDWPMRWHFEQVSFEPGGKDHSAAGSSRDTGEDIQRAVYGTEPPVYQMYDFISVKGRKGKMSSSSGDVVTIDDLKKVYTPAMIRFLFSETKPNKEFDIPFDEDIISVYQKFDHVEKVYFGEKDLSNEKKERHLKRVYELAMVDIPDEKPVRAPFDHLAFLAQTRPKKEWRSSAIKSLKKTGHVPEDISEKGKEWIIERMEKALKWAKNHAPEKYRYDINEEVPEEIVEELSDEQIKAVRKIVDNLRNKDFKDSSELDDRLFGIKNETELSTGEFFTTAYRCLLNQERGPRLSNFIMGLGEDRVADILDNV